MLGLCTINVGSTEQIFALICSIEQKVTSKGDPYLIIELSDSSGKQMCRSWNCTLDAFPGNVGDIYVFEISVSLYQNSPTYTIKSYRRPLPHERVVVEDYIKRAPRTGEDMYNALIKVTDSFENDELKKVVQYIYQNNKEKLLYWSAAKLVHHNIYSGLLWHKYRMVYVGSAIAKVYKDTISRDLLLAGIMLHDIGKLSELHTDKIGNATYTDEGELIGHSTIGYGIILEACHKLEISKDVELQLEHIIVSHHGKPEFGSSAKPKTFEASMVHLIDMIDATAYQFEETLESIEPKSFSSKIYGLDTKVYKHGI